MTAYRNLLPAASMLPFLFGCGGGGGSSSSAPTPTPPPAIDVQLQLAASGFAAPVFFATIPASSGRHAVVEQRGTIQLLAANFSVEGTLLDISARTVSSGEQGLLGLAFDPAIAGNGYFYVNYISAKTDGRCVQAADARCTRISRFTLNRDGSGNFVYTTVDSGSEQVLLEVSQPYTNHNGGMLAFGPDNYLYIALGDGGSGGDPQGNAQNLGTLLGKILRIDPNSGTLYGIPGNNPFIGTGGARAEVWAYGLRNPWRFSFDRQTGDLWAADVGQNAYEEIDIITRGGNYGWNAREGKHAYNGGALPMGAIDPVYEYDRTLGQSITGGYVYRGNAIPALRGQYVYADFVSGALWALNPGPLTNQLLANTGRSISSFGEDADGELYLLDHSNGSLVKIAPGVAAP